MDNKLARANFKNNRTATKLAQYTNASELRQALIKRTEKRKKNKQKPTTIFDFPIQYLKSKNFRYIHSNTATFYKTYNKLKNDYATGIITKFNQDLAYKMNDLILTKLKNEELKFAKTWGGKEECLKFMQELIDNQTLSIGGELFEEARKAVYSEVYGAKQLYDKNAKEFKDINSLAKNLHTLLESLHSFFPTQSSDTYYNTLTKFQATCNQVIEECDGKSINTNTGLRNTFVNTFPSAMGYIEEILKTQVAKDFVMQSIQKKLIKDGTVQLTGTKSNVYISDDSVSLPTKGQQLTDVTITIRYNDARQSWLGLNIKSNAEQYTNKGRKFIPADIISNDSQEGLKYFQEWANFQQYVYWNTLSWMAWHPEDFDFDISEIALLCGQTLEKVSNSLLSTAYLLGLPSIFIANNVDAPAIIEFTKPGKIASTAIQYIGKNIQNFFIVLHNKVYWTSDVYTKAIDMYYNNPTTQAVSGNRASMPISVPMEIYNQKKEFLRTQKYTFGSKQKELTNEEDIYPQLQQMLENKGLLNKIPGAWYFIRGSESGSGVSKQFQFELKYNIHMN